VLPLSFNELHQGLCSERKKERKERKEINKAGVTNSSQLPELASI
jgi:hypothetical protein